MIRSALVFLLRMNKNFHWTVNIFLYFLICFSVFRVLWVILFDLIINHTGACFVLLNAFLFTSLCAYAILIKGEKKIGVVFPIIVIILNFLRNLYNAEEQMPLYCNISASVCMLLLFIWPLFVRKNGK